ncbi:MAG TPA: GTPase HflX [Devosiaceae bacterium]
MGIICPDEHRKQVRRTAEARLSEFVGLAEAIGLAIAFADIVRVREVRPSTYIGGGQVEEIARRVKDGEIELLLFDAALTPIQQRNLERATGAKVLDRTALILEIFGERARTREGVLQVELAHLNYQKSRLVRSWTHLERQRGGFGFLGGPGETQIESDRRLLQERIALIEKRIDKVRKTRAVQRGPRGAVPFPIVALVGYTNAGKSSLFNTLTGATVEAKNLLFATLDPTVRKLSLPHGREVMLSDTVGFIADLPTDLVAAFRATLEEVVEADIILHVRDISNPDQQAQAADVLDVLAQLGVTPESKPFIEVWNKIDLLSPQNAQDANVSLVPAGKVAASCRVSALTGQGIPELLLAIETEFASRARVYRVEVPHERGEDVGWLYAHSEVISADEPDETSTRFHVRVEPRNRDALLLRFKGRVTPSDAP